MKGFRLGWEICLTLGFLFLAWLVGRQAMSLRVVQEAVIQLQEQEMQRLGFLPLQKNRIPPTRGFLWETK